MPEGPPTTPTRPSPWREAVAAALAAVGVTLVSLSVTAVWLNGTLMDEDRWIETVAPLGETAIAQQWMAESVSAAVLGAVDLHGYVDSALGWIPGEAAEEFAAPLIGATEETFRTSVEQVVSSDAFPAIWEQMNRAAHKMIIAAVTAHRDGIVTADDGTVALDTSALVDAVVDSLADRGFGFVRLVKVPESRRRIVLLESEAVAGLVEPVILLNRLAWVLPLAATVFLAAAFGISTRRWRLLAWVGAGLAVAAMMPLEAIVFGRLPFAQAVYLLRGSPDIGAQTIEAILFRGHVEAERTLAATGALVLAAAVLAGRTGITALRRSSP